MSKRTRQAKYDAFKADYLEQVGLRYDVEEIQGVKYIIHTEGYGIVEYFPKSDRLLIRLANDWVDFGLTWIRVHLLS